MLSACLESIPAPITPAQTLPSLPSLPMQNKENNEICLLEICRETARYFFFLLGEELHRKEKPQSPHSTDGKLSIIEDAGELLKVRKFNSSILTRTQFS